MRLSFRRRPRGRFPAAFRRIAAGGIFLASFLVLSSPPVPGKTWTVKDSPAVCVLQKVRVEVAGDDGKRATRTEETVYAIRREDEVLDDLRMVRLVEAYEIHPRAAEVELIRAEGKPVRRRINSFQRTPFLTDAKYVSDSELLYLTLPKLAPGDTLRVRTKTRIEPFLGFSVEFLGSSGLPTERAVFETVIPESLAPRYKSFHGVGDPKETRKGGEIHWKWTAGPVELPERERLGPPPADFLPAVSIGVNRIAWGPADSWESLAATCWERMKDRVVPVPEATREATEDQADLPPEDRLLDYVQKTVRYVAIELGPGGKIPDPAPEVFRKRYGDCKNMATLLLSLLQAEGRTASLALVLTRHQSGLHVDPLPTLQYFNHAIVCAQGPEGDEWLDATDSYGTRQAPRYDIQGAPALVLSGPGRGFRRIPYTGPSRNRSIRSLHLVDDGQGHWLAGETKELTGLAAERTLRWLDRKNDIAPDFRKYVSSVGLTPTDSVRVDPVDTTKDSTSTCRLAAVVPVTYPLHYVSGRTVVRPAWNRDPYPLQFLKKRKRKADLYWPALETFVDTTRFAGTCYRAANWIRVGVTTGRGKNDHTNRPNRPVKAVWGYALTRNFRSVLCGGAS